MQLSDQDKQLATILNATAVGGALLAQYEKHGELSLADFDSIMGNASFNGFDSIHGDGAHGSQAVIVNGLNQGVAQYRAHNGGDLPSASVIASALAQAQVMMTAGDNNPFQGFDSLTADHGEAQSVVAAMSAVSIATAIFGNLPFYTPLPNPIGSNQMPLVYTRLTAGMAHGALAQNEFLDGAKASQPYVTTRRKFAMAVTTGTTYAVTPRLSYLDFKAKTPDPASPRAPFLGGRVGITVNGILVASDYNNLSHPTKGGTSVLAPVQGVVIAGVPVAVTAATANLDTDEVKVTFAAALPVGAKVTAITVLDYDRKDGSGTRIVQPPNTEISVERQTLLAQSMQFNVNSSRHAMTQISNELGVDFYGASIAIAQNKHYLERNIAMLEDATERAAGVDHVVTFDASRGATAGLAAAYNGTGAIMAEIQKVIGAARVKIIKTVGQAATGYDLYVTDNLATLLNEINGVQGFTSTQAVYGTDTAITRIGTFKDGTNVYCLPKNSNVLNEAGDASQALLVARHSDPIKNVFVGFTAVPLITRSIPDTHEDIMSLYSRECMEINPIGRFGDQVALIECINLPTLGV